MERPIFYFKNFTTWDKVTLLLYLFLSLGLYLLYANAESIDLKKDILAWYPLGTHMFFYFVNYKSLRNLSVYSIWFFFGLIHFYIYLQLISDPLLEGAKVHYATGLRNTVLLLLVFQFLRVISAVVQGQELVCPSKSRTDLFEERNVNMVDFALFAVYMFCVVALELNFQFHK